MCHFAKACMFFLIALVASAWAFQCYVCNSKNDTGCDSPPREEYLKTCEDLHYSNHGSQAFTVCRLQVINSENKGVIYDRRCGWIKHNENRETCTLTGEYIRYSLCIPIGRLQTWTTCPPSRPKIFIY